MSTDADKVRAAADYIERVGLHKGSTSEHAGSAREAVAVGAKCCTLGAVWGHDFEPHDFTTGTNLLSDFVGQGVATWNDAPERTKDEVVTMLRAFADTLDAQP